LYIYTHFKKKNNLSNFLFKNQYRIELYERNSIEKNSITINNPLTIADTIINHYCNQFINNNNFDIGHVQEYIENTVSISEVLSDSPENYITKIKEIQEELNIHNIKNKFNEFVKIKNRSQNLRPIINI